VTHGPVKVSNLRRTGHRGRRAGRRLSTLS